jgi:hypothetical protein
VSWGKTLKQKSIFRQFISSWTNLCHQPLFLCLREERLLHNLLWSHCYFFEYSATPFLSRWSRQDTCVFYWPLTLLESQHKSSGKPKGVSWKREWMWYRMIVSISLDCQSWEAILQDARFFLKIKEETNDDTASHMKMVICINIIRLIHWGLGVLSF